MADNEDRASLFGELRRFAKTSGAVGGIAMRVAGSRMGLKGDNAGHAEDLRVILGGLKGPMMKVAQFLTTIPDALPEEYANELSQLQANAPSMVRAAADAGRAWGGLAVEVSELRPDGHGGRFAWPGASGGAAGWPGGGVQAAVSGYGEHDGGRSAPVAAGDVGVSADG